MYSSNTECSPLPLQGLVKGGEGAYTRCILLRAFGVAASSAGSTTVVSWAAAARLRVRGGALTGVFRLCIWTAATAPLLAFGVPCTGGGDMSQ